MGRIVQSARDMATLVHHRTGVVMAGRVVVLRGIRTYIGLIGRTVFPINAAYVIPQCNRVHTWGVRFPIGVLFCDDALRVVATVVLPPWRVSDACREATTVIEVLPALITARHVVEGDMLEVRP